MTRIRLQICSRWIVVSSHLYVPTTTARLLALLPFLRAERDLIEVISKPQGRRRPQERPMNACKYKQTQLQQEE